VQPTHNDDVSSRSRLTSCTTFQTQNRAAIGWAAENEEQYGVGDVARGIGKVGTSLWKGIKTVNNEFAITDRAVGAVEGTKETASRISQRTQEKVAAAAAAEAAQQAQQADAAAPDSP